MDYLGDHKGVSAQNIIFLYKGELTFDLVTSMISTVEKRLDKLEENRKIKKKFYNIFTECIQNLYYHLEKVNIDELEISTCDSTSVSITVTVREHFYSLETGNYIPSMKVTSIQTRLDEINRLTLDELKGLYKRVLNKKESSDKRIGGLGFIDIARRTGGEKLRYKFKPVTDNVSCFTLQVRLPRII